MLVSGWSLEWTFEPLAHWVGTEVALMIDEGNFDADYSIAEPRQEDGKEVVGFLLVADLIAAVEPGPRTCRRYIRNSDMEKTGRRVRYFDEDLAIAVMLALMRSYQGCGDIHGLRDMDMQAFGRATCFRR